ncbi:hypothetical protein Acsp01_40180 [Actinoplanes sp. NBRC 101535]|nr:hypothetical protein Acsp01_40180 [Actinoplanes sp. NBRC 101535]
MRRIAVLDAPSNLGLRPPTATSVPGCGKAPGALRDQGLLTRLAARDAGCLTPPRYDPGDWRPGDGVAHAPEIAAYSRALADRIGAIIDGGEFPVILGGDCSILIGAGLAMHRLGEAVGGRVGLVFVDGHSDFRHPGNASYVGAAAGEDLALVTGRGQANLAAIESRRPYFRDIDVVVLGIRAQDEYRLDLQAAGIVTRPVPALRAEGAARSAQWARDQLVDCAGYWVHMDVDVLDPAVMPAVDAPDPGGIAFPELELLLSGLVESPHCLGVEITVFDPDYDPDGRYAAEIASAVVSGLSAVRATDRPDLVAAREDLATPLLPVVIPEADVVPKAVPDPVAVVAPEVAVEPVARAEPEVDADSEVGAEPEAVVENGEPVGEDGSAQDLVAEIDQSADQSDGDESGPSDSEPAVVDPAEGAAESFEGGAAAGDSLDGETDAVEPADEIAEPVDQVTQPGDELAEPADESAEPEDELTEPADEPVRPADELPRPEDELAQTVDDFVPTTDSASVAEPDISDESTAADEAERVVPVTATADPGEPRRPDIRLLSRPLGSAPLLDSEPLPATRPGMLRPRPPMDPPAAGALWNPYIPGPGLPPGAA